MEHILVYMKLSDRRYQQRLGEFLTKNYRQLIVKTVENGQEEKSAGAEKGLILIDRTMPEEEKRRLCRLFGRPVCLDPREGINPYQSGHVIAKRLLDISKQESLEDFEKTKERSESRENEWGPKSILPAEKSAGELFAVYSPSGGIGCSSLCRAIAKALAAESAFHQEELNHAALHQAPFPQDALLPARGVLLLSMETASDWRQYQCPAEPERKESIRKDPLRKDPARKESFDSGEYLLSELLYSYVTEPFELWEERLSQTVLPQADGYDFLPPTKDFEDLFCLTTKETDELIDRLLQRYRYVVTDLGKQWTRVQRQFFFRSRKTVLLTENSLSGREKLASIERQLGRSAAPRITVVKKKEVLGRRGADSMKEKADLEIGEEKKLYEPVGGCERLREQSEYYQSVKWLVKTKILFETKEQREQ